MMMTSSKLNGTAVAALLSLPLASGAALAQQSQETNQGSTDQTRNSASQQDSAQQQSSQSATGSGSAAGDQQGDAVVATVGDAEIRGSDVMTVIGMLPPQLQSQPQQMLVPMALQQLILRELILEEARGQNLADDPEVVALVERSSQAAEEDAMVQVWLNREMANVVTDEAVQQAYDDAQAQSEQEQLPPIQEIRPQIEQHLRQQALQDIQARLRQGADIVLYDPAGRPIEQQQNGQDHQGQGAQSGGNTPDGSSGSGSDAQFGAGGGNAGEQSTEDATGSSTGSGEQSQTD